MRKQRESFLKGIIVFLLGIIIAGSVWIYFMLQEGTVALIADQKITEAEFKEELKKLYGKEVLDEMINKRVVRMAADKYDIKASQAEIQREYNKIREGYNTEEEFITYLKEQMGWTKEQLLKYIDYNIIWEEIATKDVNISDEQVRSYYHENLSFYSEPEKIRIQQIIVETKEEADQVINEVNSGSDFNTLAKERSIDILTAGNGGDLGLVTLDDPSIDPVIINKAKTVKLNEISTVKIDEGYAIIRVTDHKSAVQYPFEEVKEEIRREIALNQVDSLPEVLERLKEEMNVQILDASLKKF